MLQHQQTGFDCRTGPALEVVGGLELIVSVTVTGGDTDTQTAQVFDSGERKWLALAIEQHCLAVGKRLAGIVVRLAALVVDAYIENRVGIALAHLMLGPLPGHHSPFGVIAQLTQQPVADLVVDATDSVVLFKYIGWPWLADNGQLFGFEWAG